MNYQKIYNDLIQSRKINPTKSDYYETHHILPKSMGGDNSKDNLVKLTAREHFIAHWLLWRIYRNKETALAFHSMTIGNNKQKERYYNSKGYEEARKASSINSKGINNFFYGKKHTKIALLKMSKSKKGIFTDGCHPRSRKVINLNTLEIFDTVYLANKSIRPNAKNGASIILSIKNKTLCSGMFFEYYDETKDNKYYEDLFRKIKYEYDLKIKNKNKELGYKRRGIRRSDNFKKKLSESKLGIAQNTVICPYCLKEGGISNMKRYHFENCKTKSY